MASPSTSATVAKPPTPKIASRTNWMKAPTVMSPASTPLAPSQTTPATPQNISAMMIAVSSARQRMRRSAAAKARFTAVRKRPSRSFSMP